MQFFIVILLKYVFVLQKKNILNQSVYFFVNSFKTMAFLIQFTFLACNTKSILNFEYTTATDVKTWEFEKNHFQN